HGEKCWQRVLCRSGSLRLDKLVTIRGFSGVLKSALIVVISLRDFDPRKIVDHQHSHTQTPRPTPQGCVPLLFCDKSRPPQPVYLNRNPNPPPQPPQPAQPAPFPSSNHNPNSPYRKSSTPARQPVFVAPDTISF